MVLKLKRGGQDVTVTLTRQEVEEDSVDSKFLKAENGKKLGTFESAISGRAPRRN